MVKPVLFGKFCLLERISVGGMAEVFRAKPMDAPGFEKFLALKRILPNLAEDDEFISMFIDEAKIAVQLTHRNICQIYELGRLNDSHYIVMEFISGRDVLAIQNRLRRERRIMSVGMAAYLCRQIACGLDHAHRKCAPDGTPLNIIHRDISPQNVLVSYTGEVKVIDFGIAKAATRSQKTQVGVLKGKFGYMSPEQVKGLPLDRRSDVFALGTLFYEMLTCRRLFHGESDFATLEMVRRGEHTPASELNPNVPPEIDAIVARALAPEADDRYQWCSEMMDELSDFLQKLRPPYTERTLDNWMQRTFEEETRQEQEKRQIFARFKSVEDVQEHNERLRQELAAEMGLPPEYDGADSDQIASEATQVWDPSASYNLPGAAESSADEDATMQDIDLPDLAALHTQIANMSGSTTPFKPPSALKPPPTTTGPVAYVPPSMAHLYQNQQPPPPSTSQATRLGVVLVVCFGFISMLLVAALAYVFFFTDMTRDRSRGAMMVNTRPIQEVEVLLNGKLIATRTPHVHRDLAPGRYTLEIRGQDHAPATQIVSIEGGLQFDVTVDLTPLPVGKGDLTLTLTPPEAEVHLDGKQVQGVGSKRSLSLDDRGEHIVEVRLAGHYVEELRLEVSNGQQVNKTIALRPIQGEIKLTSGEVRGKVLLDGQSAGTTPTTLKGLNPLEIHQIVIQAKGYHDWKKSVLFYPSHPRTYQATLRRSSDEPPPEEVVKVGYLTVDSGDTWWRIFVNDWDSGLTTPITEKRRLTLPAGQHTISYVRGDERHSVKITIEEGKTASLTQTFARP